MALVFVNNVNAYPSTLTFPPHYYSVQSPQSLQLRSSRRKQVQTTLATQINAVRHPFVFQAMCF